MFRKQLIPLLLERPCSLVELAETLEMKVTDVEDDLEHLLRSAKHEGFRITIEPARCRHCGFTFRKDKLHRPGRCPSCRKSWISEPLIGLEEASR